MIAGRCGCVGGGLLCSVLLLVVCCVLLSLWGIHQLGSVHELVGRYWGEGV